MSLADRACGTERAADRLREAVSQERTGASVVEVASDALTFASGHLKVAATLGPLYWPAFERNIFMTRPLARLRPQLRRSLGRLGRGWLRAGEKAACGCVWGFRLRHAGNPRHPGGCCWRRCELRALDREGHSRRMELGSCECRPGPERHPCGALLGRLERFPRQERKRWRRPAWREAPRRCRQPTWLRVQLRASGAAHPVSMHKLRCSSAAPPGWPRGRLRQIRRSLACLQV